ncbi:MAG TPA: methyl-accepting chemotaxis protein [Spirochaetota bacterium]|nr:methyl-accepting chemotaxis protein [Spirochaetota bacterium]HPJ33349.1 methyl-accepting chemotaxis protein [Spirochaetota bacterium]
MKKLWDFILSEYSENDFVRYKKAQFTFIFALSISAGIILLLIFGFFALDADRFRQILISASLLLISCLIIMILIRKGKMEFAANFLAYTACLIAALGFIKRPFYLSGVTMGVFMHLDMAYATLYCSPLVSFSILAIFIATHTYLYLFIAKPAAEGIFIQIASSTYIDGLITLTLIFILGYVTSRFLNRAVNTAVDESGKNVENFARIKSMMDAIKNTIIELNESITGNLDLIIKYSDNAQSHAASIEELSATVEEISAGTDSVTNAALDQNSSVENLIASIDALSESINSIEINGGRMKETLLSFMEKARKGSEASGMLDAINKKILQNSNDITEVITIIEQFFDKINLLSLNATIEAARAGEHGKGFAVVAEEIGKLAEHSTQELNRIGELINKNKSDSNENNKIISQILAFISEIMEALDSLQNTALATITALEDQKKLKIDMDEKSKTTKEKTDQINISMKEQQIAVDGIAVAIEDTGKIIQENADNTRGLQESADNLQKISLELEELVKD